jgi:hypothetical protein
MLTYLADLVLLAVICSIPYVVSRQRLRSRRSRNAMYDLARYTTGMCRDRV